MRYHEQPRFTMSYHDNPRFTMSYHESGATVTHAVRTESQARLVVRHGSHPMQSIERPGETGRATRQRHGHTWRQDLKARWVVRHSSHPRQSGSLGVRHSQARLVVRHGAHPRQSGEQQVRIDKLPGKTTVTHAMRTECQAGLVVSTRCSPQAVR